MGKSVILLTFLLMLLAFTFGAALAGQFMYYATADIPNGCTMTHTYETFGPLHYKELIRFKVVCPKLGAT